MSPHQAVAVAVRLFAVWLATYLIRTTPFYVVGLGGHDNSGLIFASAIVTALGFVIAAALWFFPLTIARKILPIAAAAPAPPQPPDIWLSMGCSLIGLWMLATSVSGLLQNGFALYYVDRSYGVEIPTEIKHGMLHSLLNVAVAAWLILGARGFVLTPT
jgi:hypothetical protein